MTVFQELARSMLLGPFHLCTLRCSCTRPNPPFLDFLLLFLTVPRMCPQHTHPPRTPQPAPKTASFCRPGPGSLGIVAHHLHPISPCMPMLIIPMQEVWAGSDTGAAIRCREGDLLTGL